MDLDALRMQWNGVLDALEKADRIAWMAFFDARLDSFDGSILYLDFSDARKFGGAHEYAPIRERHLHLLQNAIKEVLSINVEVREKV